MRMNKYTKKPHPIYSLMEKVSTKTVFMISVHAFFLLLIVLTDALDYQAKVSLFAFLLAMTLWIVTKVPAGFVAVGLLVFIVLMKAASADLLYDSLAEEVVWLMIGSFIIGEAVKQSGLAERFSRAIMDRSHNKSHVLFGISSVLFTSAFFIPSTSGRAALSLPIMNQLGQKFSNKEKSVLAIIAPVIILMSTSATLIGAGSHLIGIGLLESTVDQSISYLQWLIWGVPFSLVMTMLSFVTIKGLLWPKNEIIKIEKSTGKEGDCSAPPLNVKEKKTLILIAMLIIGWMTEGIHGYDVAFITMIGAMLVMLPNYGLISWKTGLKSVSWNLIVFVAAATSLGKVLVDTGVVKWMETELFSALHLLVKPSEWLIVLIILLVTVTSHLYITSHTTRAVIFIPSFLVFSETMGIDPTAVVFLSLIGMNYFPVSSKALLLFYEEGGTTFEAKQLMKISAVLMPLYILIMMIFYFTYWNWTGMDLYVR